MSKVRITARFSARSRGFSVIELVVVVMIILALVAIAVPRMMSARMRANEASAIASMRTIQQAEGMYQNWYPEVGFSGNLADLGSHGSNCEPSGKTNACLIMDNLLTSGMKSGYIFELLGDGNTPARAYTLTATPQSLGYSGRCTFVSDQSGIIREQSANGQGTAVSAGPSNSSDRTSLHQSPSGHGAVGSAAQSNPACASLS